MTKTPTKICTILFFLFAISCANQNTEKPLVESNSSNQDTVLTESPEAGKIKPADLDKIVSDRFLNLIKSIDSAGFIFDTIRYKKVNEPKHPDNLVINQIENYLIYTIPLKETVPYQHIEKCESGSMHSKEWCEKWFLSKEKFVQVKNISQYYFREKKPTNSTTVDGIVEEWTFQNIETAKEVAENLGTTESMVYVNRGAYICYIENYVYIFHSRSAGFYTPLKIFFKQFSANYHAQIPNNRVLRKGY